jgi:hypothetical protein
MKKLKTPKKIKRKDKRTRKPSLGGSALHAAVE